MNAKTRLPNFFMIGAPKCGTTAMCDFLAQHPEIFFTNPKEPCYFSREFLSPDSRWAYQSLADYLKLYQSAKEHQLLGEGTTLTLYSQLAAQEILKLVPDAKFIIMLRNPISAAISMHGQNLKVIHKTYREPEMDFTKAWLRCMDQPRSPRESTIPMRLRYDLHYKYSHLLDRWYAQVSKDRIHIIIYDDFVKDNAAEFKKVCHFLKIDPNFMPIFKKINERSIIQASQYLYFLGALGQVANRINKKWGASYQIWLDNQLMKYAKPLPKPVLSVDFLQGMQSYFREDVQKTGALVGRDLAFWLEQNATG